VTVTDLTSLVGWRRAEMIQAEALSFATNCPLTVLGVKHPLEVGSKILEGADSLRRVYLSHPISRPRRQHRLSGTWPQVVDQFNSIPLELAKGDVATIMPTAIDEYRLEPPSIENLVKSPTVLDLASRRPRLTARWLPAATEAGLIFADAGADWDFSFAASSASESKRITQQVGGQLRSLENVIQQQIPYRDHLLVTHLPNLLVFRPLYGSEDFDQTSGTFPDGGGTFSAGVRREIEHWQDLAAASPGSARRAAFIHSQEDVRRLVKLLSGSAELEQTGQSASKPSPPLVAPDPR
jgi:hypothetical protein